MVVVLQLIHILIDFKVHSVPQNNTLTHTAITVFYNYIIIYNLSRTTLWKFGSCIDPALINYFWETIMVELRAWGLIIGIKLK